MIWIIRDTAEWIGCEQKNVFAEACLTLDYDDREEHDLFAKKVEEVYEDWYLNRNRGDYHLPDFVEKFCLKTLTGKNPRFPRHSGLVLAHEYKATRK